mmetsp:Transcript_19825/g.43138  ORF Transcript_19825/g.43138 Transcript_19825/m.43138 type:complete len:627 (+) Transcript_19825:361-2241(+)
MKPGISKDRELLVKFKVVKFLGKGSYGSVFQVQRLTDGNLYALKEMDVRSMSQAEREDSVNEIRLLASVAHPNVIAYHEAFLDGNRLCIIMEYAPDGDLAKVIKKYQMLKRPMPEDLIWKYFIQVALGLAALHNMKILHRDIKPGNIMVMANDVAKIGDLGIAKLLKHTMAKTQIGTPHYMPPEIWRNRPYSFTSDSWALGCLLYEMSTFSVPFEARSMSELRYKVLRGSYPPVPSSYSRDLQQMVRDCLDPNPDKRPTMDQILATPSVVNRMHLLGAEVSKAPPSTAGSVLLDTIKVPRNFAMVKNKLPPAKYSSDPAFVIAEGDEDEEVDQVHKLPPQVQQQQQQARMGGGQYGGLPQLPQALRPAKDQQRQGPLPGGYGAPPPMQQPMYQGGMGGLPNINPKPKPPPLATPGQGGAYLNADQKPWYVKESRISESHAAYGAFYHTPTAASAAAAAAAAAARQGFDGANGPALAAAAAARAQYAMPQQQQQQQAVQVPQRQYKGYYQPPGYGPRPGWAGAAGGAGGGGGQPGRLPALAQVGGGLQPAARAPPPAPAGAAGGGNGGGGGGGGKGLPPWNYGAGANKAAISPLRNNALLQAQAGGGGDAAGMARYPPMQWAPPRMR